MLDLTTRAIVLDKEDIGEYNSRVSLYTEKLGGVAAYATSTRKLASKLAAHLEPLNIVDVRLVEKRSGSFQIGDALVVHSNLGWKSSFDKAPVVLKIISILKEQSFNGNFDIEIWNLFYQILLTKDGGSLKQCLAKFLTVLGFNPKYASCALCGSGAPRYFLLRDFYFYCDSCAPSLESSILEMPLTG